MKFRVEYRSPEALPNGKHPVVLRWTTPEVADFDAGKAAAKARAVKAGYTVRSVNFRQAGKDIDIVAYVTKGGV